MFEHEGRNRPSCFNSNFPAFPLCLYWLLIFYAKVCIASICIVSGFVTSIISTNFADSNHCRLLYVMHVSFYSSCLSLFNFYIITTESNQFILVSMLIWDRHDDYKPKVCFTSGGSLPPQCHTLKTHNAPTCWLSLTYSTAVSFHATYVLICVSAEEEVKLWPYIWAGGNDPGVQTTSQEEEKAREKDQRPGIWWLPTGKILNTLKRLKRNTVQESFFFIVSLNNFIFFSWQYFSEQKVNNLNIRLRLVYPVLADHTWLLWQRRSLSVLIIIH